MKKLLTLLIIHSSLFTLHLQSKEVRIEKTIVMEKKELEKIYRGYIDKTYPKKVKSWKAHLRKKAAAAEEEEEEKRRLAAGKREVFSGKRRFKKNSKNTVKDIRGLIWQKGNSGRGMSWGDAKEYCRNLSLDGYSDWRLPSFNELYYLADRTKYKPAIDTNYFQESGKWYWTATKYDSSKAWFVGFDVGYDNWYGKSGKYYVRCVRGRQ